MSKPYLLARPGPLVNRTWIATTLTLLTAVVPSLSPATNLASGPTFIRSTQQHSTVPGSPRALLNTTPQDRAPAYTGRAHGQRKVQQPDQRGSLLTTLLGVTDNPRKQLDWPNPRGARNVHYTIDWNWRGTPQVILGSIAAFKQLDWPNPRGAKPNQGLGYTTGGLTLLTSALDNTILTHRQRDWVNPPGPRYPSDLRGFTSAGLSAFYPTLSSSNLGSVSWRKSVGMTSAWGTPQTLTGTIDTNLPLRVMTDQPNPRGARNILYTIDWNWRGTYQGILSSIVPFGETDWPNPRGAKPNQDLGYVTGGLTLLTSAVDSNLPLRVNTDQPNPRGYKNLLYVTDWNWRGTPQVVLGSIAAFTQGDWPNPRGAKPNQDLGYVTGGLTLLTSAVDTNLPLRTITDQPNPRGYKNLLYTVDWNWRGTPQVILGSIAAFKQLDWPNPRGAKPNQPLGITVGNNGLVYVDQAPLNQLDWPLPPRGPQYPMGLRTYTDSFRLTLTTVRPPYTQYDWPVPKGPIYPLSIRATFDRWDFITEFVLGIPDPDRVVCVRDEARIVDVVYESREVTPDERQSCQGS